MASPTRDWIKPAQQYRSRETEDAIIAAATALLAERPFEQISVAEIAQRAGVSIGGFYARFRNKGALLHLLDEHFLVDSRAAFDREMAPERVAGAGAAAVIAAYVRVMVAKFREHRVEILQVMRGARSGAVAGQGAQGFRDRARRFNDHVHGRLRALLLERRAEIRHPQPEQAIELGLFFASAAAREAILSESLRAYPVEIDDDRLSREITRAYLAFLGVSLLES